MRDNNPQILIDAAPLISPNLDHDQLRRAVRAALDVAAVDPRRPGHLPHSSRLLTAEVSILVTDDTEMQRLNREYRGVDAPTDVLSFSLLDGPAPTSELAPAARIQLGDIVLSVPYAKRQAEDLGHSLGTEMAWLVIHGTLQLLGYHHAGDAEAEHMERLEQEALLAAGALLPDG